MPSEPLPTRPAVGLGAAAAGLTAGLYAIAIGRELTYDGAITYANFIVTPHLSDSWTRQVGYNNHLLFSVLEHLVYTLTGNGSEALLRVLPIAAGAASVGLLTFAAGRRLGPLAGFAAGAFLAASPLFATLSRDLRGYSLLCLCAVASSLLLPALLDPGGRRRGARVAYGGIVAAGFATHLYMLLALLGQGAWVLASAIEGRHAVGDAAGGGRNAGRATAGGHPADSTAAGSHQAGSAARAGGNTSRVPVAKVFGGWLAAALVGAAVGMLPYVPMLPGLERGGRLGELQPTFPVDLVGNLLGGDPLALLALLPLTAVALAQGVRDRRVAAVAGLYAALVLGLWLVARPHDLYPRFFVVLLPGLGWLLAAAVRRTPALGLVLGAGIILGVLTHLSFYTADELALRAVSSSLRGDAAAGLRTCVLANDDLMLRGFLGGFTTVRTPADLDRCDSVGSVSDAVATADLLPATRAAFPQVQTFPALRPGLVFRRAAHGHP